jgi:N-acetyl-anhydromuramyl-L-alanine amidase AmpD
MINDSHVDNHQALHIALFYNTTPRSERSCICVEEISPREVSGHVYVLQPREVSGHVYVLQPREVSGHVYVLQPREVSGHVYVLKNYRCCLCVYDVRIGL